MVGISVMRPPAPSGIVQPCSCTERITVYAQLSSCSWIGGPMPAVEREVTVPAPPHEVWPAVTKSDELSSWFGADVRLEPRPGGRGVFRWADGVERHVVVEHVESERRLA